MKASRRWTPILRPDKNRRLPRALQPSRVGSLAKSLPEGIHDPGFLSLLEKIESGPFHSGNHVEVFSRGDAAFAAMLGCVKEGRTEVLLESYILKDDATGQLFADELIRAAARGVAVRVLADGFGSMATRRAFWSNLIRNGVEARLYHPLLALRYLKFRDHRKILVVDRRVAFTGGMNIGDEYGSSLLPSGQVWRDTHARVEGAAAWEMAVVFQEGWEEAGGSAIGLESLVSSEGPGAGVMVLDSLPGRGSREVASVMTAISAAARRTLWLTTAYFAPRRRAIGILGAAARRGVDVRLLVPGRTDVPIARHAGHGFFAALLARGVRIYEYQPAILHAKTVVADGLLSVVGSSNLDFRSFELNAECNFVIVDRGTAQRMEAQYREDLAQAVPIDRESWGRRRVLHRIGDSLARRLAPLL
ncbi:MAG: phospholipase D-like domain-containing protein [Acidobacteriota bacterium]